MTLSRHRTCTYGRADMFLVLVSNGQVAALGDWFIINRLWLYHAAELRKRSCALLLTSSRGLVCARILRSDSPSDRPSKSMNMTLASTSSFSTVSMHLVGTSDISASTHGDTHRRHRQINVKWHNVITSKLNNLFMTLFHSEQQQHKKNQLYPYGLNVSVVITQQAGIRA